MALIQELLSQAADLIETHGWDCRYRWQKSSDDGLSIMDAVERACDAHRSERETCLAVLRRRFDDLGRISIGDFEGAAGRTKADIVAILRASAEQEAA